MSYQRPSPAAGPAGSNQSKQNDLPQQHQSPLDWNNYTYLGNTPPGSTPTAPSSNSNNGYNQSQDGYQQPYNQANVARPQETNYNSGSNNQYRPPQNNLQVPPNQSSSSVKGKSPVHRPDLSSRVSNPAIDPANPDNGLSLDPAAFSRDIRFQLPSFMSNQMGGVQTFPPGGEAWSGFSFPDAQNGSGPGLTPGSMFNNLFGLGSTPDGQNFVGGSDGNENRNVLQGLSGFMDGDNSWGDWNMDTPKGDSVSQPVAPTAAFYVNPNPTSSVPQRTATDQRQVSQNLLGKQNVARPGESPRSSSYQVSPHPNSAAMPTSAILPPTTAFHNSLQRPDGLPYVPSVSASTGSNNNMNIASSSTAPYAPPSNTDQLLSGPSLPSSFGPSLSDGPGLYSTTGFDMVGVLARVGNRKDPKTVLGPIDLSCSFVVVVSHLYSAKATRS
jgi:hypothetical protein